MSRITEELRAWWVRKFPVMDKELHGDFTAIADRIDERVTGLLREQDATLRAEFDAMSDGWILLPKDADGEPIHIGDVMEWCDSGETLEVVGIGDDCLYYLDGEEAEWTAARNKRHHHAPTVEDVLREFAERYLDYEGVPSAGRRGIGDALMDEYAARLRLREDA